MYPLHPPGPALRKSNTQNVAVAASRHHQQGTVRHHHGSSRYTLPRSKASATVSLTNTSANASCITTTTTTTPPAVANTSPLSIIPDPVLSPPSPRSGSNKKNVIPFPSSSTSPAPCHSSPTAMDDPFFDLLPTPTPTMFEFPELGFLLGSDIGLNDALSRYQHQQPYRRRRSPPQQQQQRTYPHWNTHPTPNPNIRKYPNSPSSASSRQSAPAPRTNKRPRKNKRVVADLHFVALVHRSILNRVRESGVNIDVYPDGGGGTEERMQVDGDFRVGLFKTDQNSILFGQEDVLLRRLWMTLVENGYGTEDDIKRVRFVDPDSEAETSMDVDSPDILQFPLLPPGLALPSTPPPSPLPPPTPSNSPNPNSTSPGKITQILSMPQLVAALIMRHRYRPSGREREREREKERGGEKGRRPTAAGRPGIGSSLFGRWKESFSLGVTAVGVDAGRGRGRGSGGGASLDTDMDMDMDMVDDGGIVDKNGRGIRRRSSPLSISVFTAAAAADSG